MTIPDESPGRSQRGDARIDPKPEVAGRVGGDALVTGGTVDVRGEIGEDVYAAGGDVRVEATVRGNLRAAGGSVSLEPGASVAGNATLVKPSLSISVRRLRSA